MLWEYRLRAYSRLRTRQVEVVRCLTEREYAEPFIRDEEEQRAEAELRALEGITPATPLERVGWRRIAWGADDEEN